jgi:hypothetical protein
MEGGVGGACSMHGEMKMHRKLSQNLKVTDDSKDLSIYGGIILNWILGK